MRILFFIGNGFDINLGMKTRYTDFYNYYLSVESQNDHVAKLKQHLSSDLENWADLELSLGEYTQHIESSDEFDIVFEDIGEKLADFLQSEEDKFDANLMDKDKLLKYLAFPEHSLPKADYNNIVKFKQTWSKQPWNIDIITFNYTKTIEKILKDRILNLKIGTQYEGLPIFLRSIEHLHGFVNDRMIMGVNDISQIRNLEFHVNQDIIEAIIKSQCNKAQKHTIDNLCADYITSANLICIFGSSIGDTDNMWWELIGEQLKNNCQLIIFYRCQDIPQRLIHKKAREERKIKRLFLKKTRLNDDEKQAVENKIFVGINTDLFKHNNILN